jgi:cytochrome c biogenesis protein CcmG/thiol:disulfide interchange protein DsbE
MKRIVLSVALIACSVLAAAVSADVKPVGTRKVAPPFKLKDTKGVSVKLADFKGRVVLLNFWATWCGPCKEEIPWFIEFQKTYKDKGLDVVGISVDEKGWKVVRPYLADQGKDINYTILMDDEHLSEVFAVETMPKTLMIDRDGKVAAIHNGRVDREGVEAEIQALVAQSAAK